MTTKGAVSMHDLKTALTAGEWVSDAACSPDVAEFFWPLPGRSSGPDIDAALKLCSRCPVVRDCGQWALDNHVTEGIWGGMRPGALQRLVAKRRQAERAEAPAHPRPGVQPGTKRGGYRKRDTCRRQHPLTEDNVRLDGNGHQVCKTCDAYRERRRRARLRGAEVPVA